MLAERGHGHSRPPGRGRSAFPIRVVVRRRSHADRGGRRAAARRAAPLLPQPARRSSPTIVAGGAEPVEEHGVLAGEVARPRGLPGRRRSGERASRLEVGIGAHDRETFQLLHGDRPTVEALADVVAPSPSTAAGGAAAPAEPPRPRAALLRCAARRPSRRSSARARSRPSRRRCPAAEPEGRGAVRRRRRRWPTDHVVVVCTHGVDLDAVPYAVDAVALGPSPACVVRGRRAAPTRLDIQRPTWPRPLRHADELVAARV